MNLPFKIAVSPKLKIRGLIASKAINKKELIESCPLILIDVKYEDFLENSNLKYYYFKYDKSYFALAMGYLSLINHSQEPNCDIVIDYKNKLFNLTAIKNIAKGEELTIEYMTEAESKHFPELFDFNKGIK